MDEPFRLGRRRLLEVVALSFPASRVLAAPSPPASPQPDQWRFFNQSEVRLVEAMVGRLIPADELGPGAKEAGVVVYLDGQLAGPWGNGAHFYAKGPFQNGTPQQGYQLPYTPAAMFRAALPLIDQRSVAQNGGHAFADCTPLQQDTMLTAMQQGSFDIAPVPSAAFFVTLLDATMEGFFADPLYGGNQGMAGWKLVGFPGAYDDYTGVIEQWGYDWTRPPLSIAQAPAMNMAPARSQR